MIRTALVTGANSGIGLETALHLARVGFRVVGTVRSEEKADALAEAAGDAGVAIDCAVLDVTDPAGCEDVVNRFEPWAIVNNAGYMNVGQVVDVPPDDALRQLDALVVGPMRLATLAVPSMRRQGEGRIVNVSSVTAHATAAMTGWYQACKHALSAVTDALRRELAPDGIDVVLVEPGGLKTGIWGKAADDLRRRRARSASPTPYDRSLRVLRAARPFMAEPRAAAEVIGEALTAGHPKVHYRVGRDAPVIELVEAVLPGRVKDRLAVSALGSRSVARNRVIVDVPVGSVSAVLADPRTYDRFVVGTKRIRRFEPTWPEVGSAFPTTPSVSGPWSCGISPPWRRSTRGGAGAACPDAAARGQLRHLHAGGGGRRHRRRGRGVRDRGTGGGDLEPGARRAHVASEPGVVAPAPAGGAAAVEQQPKTPVP